MCKGSSFIYISANFIFHDTINTCKVFVVDFGNNRNMINCVIVDDQQFSVDVIVKYAKLMDRLNIISIYLDPSEALKDISKRSDVNIIFMDVDMPDISGIDLAKLLQSHSRKLIFTTSHSKYAFDAYEVNGDAFLLKPFTFTKFAETINRLFPVEISSDLPSMESNGDHFLVKNKDEDLRIVRVAYHEIIAFESVNNYVRIHLINDKKVTAYLTLKDVLDLTANKPRFKQFHRAFIISYDHINYIEGNTIFLSGNLNFKVGESFKDNFSNYLSNQLLKTARNQKSS